MKLCVLAPIEWKIYDQDPSPYFQEWHAPIFWISKATARHQVRALIKQDFDVFINLCDGCGDDEEAGIEVVSLLEERRCAFTGARSPFYDPSRAEMKRACERAGVRTPRFHFATDEREIEQIVERLRYPLIVKHPNGHCSTGLLKESRVENIVQLRAQTRRVIADYGGALIEEFIDGREFDVLVVEDADNPGEPFAYAPVEFIFPPSESFKHYDLKWVDFDSMQCVPCDDPALAARLQTISKKMFVALHGSGYGRCDIRMDARGELYLLEINPNCGVFYPPDELGSADFILTQHPNGHRDFIERIIRAASAHQDFSRLD